MTDLQQTRLELIIYGKKYQEGEPATPRPKVLKINKRISECLKECWG